MKHARSDYNAIQDQRPDGIPVDEPVFLLRAKDKLAPEAVREWAARLHHRGGDPAMVAAALRQADEMERYAHEHYGGGKVPDAPPRALDETGEE